MSKCQSRCFGIIFDKGERKNNSLMIKLLHDNVLVLPSEAEEVTKGGIIIPDTAKQKPTKGKVVTVGPGKKDEEMFLKEGDTVLYGKYSGTEITVDNVNYILLKQDNVFCVLE